MTTETDYSEILKSMKEKVERSFFLVEASLIDLAPYSPNTAYTPKELEPYDALCDRFIRCVEVFLKYFTAYELSAFSVTSDTLRDKLNVMEKVGLITNTPIWMTMRDVRNRIVHDYLPEQTKSMFDAIMSDFFQELRSTRGKLK